MYVKMYIKMYTKMYIYMFTTWHSPGVANKC